MLHRIRLALQNKSVEKLSGEVEADETFVGGLAKNMHASKRRHIGTGGAGNRSVAEPTPFQRFRTLLQAAVSVPKTEIDRREAEYKKRRKAEKRTKRGG